MKTCGKCKTTKHLDDFRKRGHSGRQAWCKSCVRDYDRDRYKTIDKKRKNKNRRAVRQRQKSLISDIKGRSVCVDCGNSDHRVLQFDHVRGKKFKEISSMIGIYSDKKLLNEINKCDIRCANCHQIKTTERRERGRR